MLHGYYHIAGTTKDGKEYTKVFFSFPVVTSVTQKGCMEIKESSEYAGYTATNTDLTIYTVHRADFLCNARV